LDKNFENLNIKSNNSNSKTTSNPNKVEFKQDNVKSNNNTKTDNNKVVFKHENYENNNANTNGEEPTIKKSKLHSLFDNNDVGE